MIVTEPVHRQLARICRERLARGDYKPEDRFPSERELAQEFGVSRVTANKVLSGMVSENLLIHKPGIGMFVAPPRTLHASLRAMESFTGHAKALGMEPETKVLQFRRLAQSRVPDPVLGGLKLEAGESVFYVERQRLLDGIPAILEFRWIRSSMVPALEKDDLVDSFYSLLEERLQIPLTGEDHIIQARIVNDSEATKLGVAAGSAALVVEGPGYTTGNKPIWYQVLLYRADRYQLENSVRLHPAQNSSVFKMLKEPSTGHTESE